MLAQLLNRSCNSPDAVFRTIRDFLAAADGIDNFTVNGSNPGPGYEIVDASYASGDPADTTTGDWCVLRSNGEAGTYPHYLRLVFGSTVHKIVLYLHWDAEAHAGFAPTGSFSGNNGNVYHNGAGQVLLWMHADLDEIHLIIRPQGTNNYYYWNCYGRLKPDHLCYSGQVAQVEGAIEAGQGTVINLPSPWPDWAVVGRKIYNWDTQSLHELTITAADETARAITVAESWAKQPGSWLTEDLLLLITNTSSPNITTGNILTGTPQRQSFGSVVVSSAYTMLLPGIGRGRDSKYGYRIGGEVNVSLNNGNEYRGRFALLRDSPLEPAAFGEPWVDEHGTPWRLYTVSTNRTIALREAL